MDVKAKAPKANNREITVSMNIPEKLSELVEAFGEEVIADAASRNLCIQAQGYIRQMLEAGRTDEEIIDAASKWVPGTKRDTLSTLVAKAKTMSAEERKVLLAALGL